MAATAASARQSGDTASDDDAALEWVATEFARYVPAMGEQQRVGGAPASAVAAAAAAAAATTATTTTAPAATSASAAGVPDADRGGSEESVSPAVGAVKVLMEVIRRTTSTTWQGLVAELRTAQAILKRCSDSMSVASACGHFALFVTTVTQDTGDFDDIKARLIRRGEQFAQRSDSSSREIGVLGAPFIRDGMVVMTHSLSRVVLAILLAAASKGARFEVIITESRPDCLGYVMAQRLRAQSLPVRVIADAAGGHFMNRVDVVIVGAEAIVENGGIINKIGTYQLSVMAHTLKKPFYVAAETFKYTRIYPLTQTDFPQKTFDKSMAPHGFDGVPTELPMVDYTPPAYITLLFTEAGVLSPSAVSDELIELYSRPAAARSGLRQLTV